MSKEFVGPFDRKVECIDRIADALTGTDDLKNPTGNRMIDSLQRIAEYFEENAGGEGGEGGEGGGVQLENQPTSTAGTVAALKEDFNSLLNKLKNAGIMEPNQYGGFVITAQVNDSVEGHADRQDNTNQINSIGYDNDDGIITITLKKKVSELKDFDGGGNWGVHKWLGFGINAKVGNIKNIKYNGSYLTDEDVYESSLCGLSDNFFVRWVAADLVLAGDETQASKSTFTIWVDGYGEKELTIRVREPSV